MTIPQNARLVWSGAGGAAMIDFSGQGLGTFFPHWFDFTCLAADARDRARESASSNDGRLRSEALSAILFSALATEALINELGVAASRDALLHAEIEGADILVDLAATLELTEKAQGQIDLKYQMASKILAGSTFPTGRAPFQDFASLIALRNRLVHPRHDDKTNQAGHVEPGSGIIRDLQQRRLTSTKGRQPGDPPGGVSWLHEIATSGVADWAYSSAREIIIALLQMLPEGPWLVGPLFRDRIAEIPA